MNQLYQFKDICLLFRSGALTKCLITEHLNQLDGDFYLITVFDRNKNTYQMRTQRDNDIHKYKSILAAINAAKKIGFKELSIKMD